MHRLITLTAACMLLGACAAGYPSPVVVAPGGYYATPVQIPPGHMPPPGECRVWYPDRPPGQQPPPGPCGVLQFQVPVGAYLVQG